MDYESYADDTTPYVYKQNYAEAMEFLKLTISNIFTCFKHNGLLVNLGKIHYLISAHGIISFKTVGFTVESRPWKELLEISIDNELTFHKHIMSLFSKANQKPNALASLAKYLAIDKRIILLNAFITAQSNYCPLIWMYHSRTLKNKTNRI